MAEAKRPEGLQGGEEKPLNKNIMEEKKEKKLSYEELSARFGELYAQYQKLMAQYRKAAEALDNRNYGYAYLDLIFKVMEHPERYSEAFVSECAEAIEKMIREVIKEVSEQEPIADEA